MKVRIIKGWRQHTSDPHSGRHVEPKWDFTALIQAMKAWK